jgi:hypothetical protein
VSPSDGPTVRQVSVEGTSREACGDQSRRSDALAEAHMTRSPDLAALLHDAEREARARLYRTLGLQLLLDPVGNRVEARLQPSGGGGGI